MTDTFDLVLADFKLNSLVDTVSQNSLNAYIAWLMAVTQNAQQRLAGQKDNFDSILQDLETLFTQYAVDSTTINHRYALPITDQLNSQQDFVLPPLYENALTEPHGADIDVRTKYFQKVVLDFFQQCYPQNVASPAEIIHVTSMGCIIPTPLHRFLTERGWLTTLSTHSYFSGCYGSVPALRTAIGALLSSTHGFIPQKNYVDIIHTEFLTQHINSLDSSPNNIICSTLFSDGFAKYSLNINSHNQPHITKGLKIICINEELIAHSGDDMRWEIGPYQFSLYLSKNIPKIIGKHIIPFVEKLCAQANMEFSSLKDHLIYAFHPGGSAILEIIKNRLKLSDVQMHLSNQLLYDKGNISSATLPYLWDTIINSAEIKSGTKILSITFGPGITMAGVVLEKYKEGKMPVFLKTREMQAKELMDNPNCDRELLFHTYRQFKTINKLFSGWHTIYKKYLLPHMQEKTTYSILDVGCGGGDILLELAYYARQDGIRVEMHGIEPDQHALAFIKTQSFPNNIKFTQATLKQLLKNPTKYDFVINNNVLHHLSTPELTEMMQDASRICQRMVIFNDLRRTDISYLMFKILTAAFFKNSFAQYDGSLSIKRSYTPKELAQLCPENWQVKKLFPYRQLAIYSQPGYSKY